MTETGISVMELSMILVEQDARVGIVRLERPRANERRHRRKPRIPGK
jgi:hypothetical protein